MRIGPYETLGELGRGGMGVVHRARAPRGDDVAVKVLLRHDEEALVRFDRERRLLSALGEEKGFVPVLDAGTSPLGPYVVMPLLPGGTLRDRLRRGPQTVEAALDLGRTLARAVAEAHALGIVHRDLKPENVLFDARGRPLVADLGLAKHFRADASGASQGADVSRTGAFRGTACYSAPEQIEDAKSVGPQTDVYALGAILYECLAGRPPFEGASLLELLTKVTVGRLEPLHRVRPDVPAWLAAAVDGALATDPVARPRDARALLRTLERPLGRRPSLGLAGAGVLAGLAVALLLRSGGRASSVVGWPSPTPAGASVAPPASATSNLAPPAATAASPRPPGEGDRITARRLTAEATMKALRRDFEGAIQDLDRALELDPRHAEAWGTRGAAKVYRGDPRGAIDDLDRAIALDPGNAESWSMRGVARLRLRDHDRAIADLGRAIELDPKNAERWAARGGARHEKADREGAIEDCTKAVELDPRCVFGWSNRGAARLAKGDHDGAVADFGRAIELDPESASAWVRRAQARGLTGDLDGAIADCAKAIELRPEEADAWWNRAVARAKKGDREGAIADLERFLVLEPTGPNTRRARQRLAELRAKR